MWASTHVRRSYCVYNLVLHCAALGHCSFFLYYPCLIAFPCPSLDISVPTSLPSSTHWAAPVHIFVYWFLHHPARPSSGRRISSSLPTSVPVRSWHCLFATPLSQIFGYDYPLLLSHCQAVNISLCNCLPVQVVPMSLCICVCATVCSCVYFLFQAFYIHIFLLFLHIYLFYISLIPTKIAIVSFISQKAPFFGLHPSGSNTARDGALQQGTP